MSAKRILSLATAPLAIALLAGCPQADRTAPDAAVPATTADAPLTEPPVIPPHTAPHPPPAEVPDTVPRDTPALEGMR
jgi:hypothetical protein